MTNTGSHSRLLTSAARTTLAPLGLVQKGRSRIWLDDHGWWLVVVEFQPSSWSMGSYLNVGAMWLWYEKDYLSFDHGDRVRGFVKYLSDDQFSPEALRLATSAREKVLEYRQTFKSTAHVARVLSAGSHQPGWPAFHLAVAYGCSGDIENARRWFRKIEQSDATFDWEKKLQYRARELADMLSNPVSFRCAIENSIDASRKLLKLPDVKIDRLFGPTRT